MINVIVSGCVPVYLRPPRPRPPARPPNQTRCSDAAVGVIFPVNMARAEHRRGVV